MHDIIYLVQTVCLVLKSIAITTTTNSYVFSIIMLMFSFTHIRRVTRQYCIKAALKLLVTIVSVDVIQPPFMDQKTCIQHMNMI